MLPRLRHYQGRGPQPPVAMGLAARLSPVPPGPWGSRYLWICMVLWPLDPQGLCDSARLPHSPHIPGDTAPAGGEKQAQAMGRPTAAPGTAAAGHSPGRLPLGRRRARPSGDILPTPGAARKVGGHLFSGCWGSLRWVIAPAAVSPRRPVDPHAMAGGRSAQTSRTRSGYVTRSSSRDSLYRPLARDHAAR